MTKHDKYHAAMMNHLDAFVENMPGGAKDEDHSAILSGIINRLVEGKGQRDLVAELWASEILADELEGEGRSLTVTAAMALASSDPDKRMGIIEKVLTLTDKHQKLSTEAAILVSAAAVDLVQSDDRAEGFEDMKAGVLNAIPDALERSEIMALLYAILGAFIPDHKDRLKALAMIAEHDCEASHGAGQDEQTTASTAEDLAEAMRGSGKLEKSDNTASEVFRSTFPDAPGVIRMAFTNETNPGEECLDPDSRKVLDIKVSGLDEAVAIAESLDLMEKDDGTITFIEGEEFSCNCKACKMTRTAAALVEKVQATMGVGVN